MHFDAKQRERERERNSRLGWWMIQSTSIRFYWLSIASPSSIELKVWTCPFWRVKHGLTLNVCQCQDLFPTSLMEPLVDMQSKPEHDKFEYELCFYIDYLKLTWRTGKSPWWINKKTPSFYGHCCELSVPTWKADQFYWVLRKALRKIRLERWKQDGFYAKAGKTWQNTRIQSHWPILKQWFWNVFNVL